MSNQFKSPVEFDQKDSLEDIVHKLNSLKRAMERTAYNSQNATLIVVGGSGTSGSSGGSSSSVLSLADSATVTAGSNTIPLPDGGFSPPTTDYIIVAVLVNATYGAQILGQPETKGLTSFTYNDLPIAGTLWFHVEKRS